MLSQASVLRSYIKTALAALCLVFVALSGFAAAMVWFGGWAGLGLIVFFSFLLLGGAIVGAGALIVLVRHKRGAAGMPDLFLELNRSREPAAIAAAGGSQASPVRRWLARRILGHDFLVGDVVEVREVDEIRATLDGRQCLEELPFMSEMASMCGKRARVFRCMHRLFDYRKTRLMRHMDHAVLLAGVECDGSRHGDCEAACHTIWKTAWLRRVDPDRVRPGSSVTAPSATKPFVANSQAGYTCQLTQLNAASKPIAGNMVARFFTPLLSGNVALAAFLVAWLTHVFNEVQELRGGIGFPELSGAAAGRTTSADSTVAAGQVVKVRSATEIRGTLNERLMNKGLWFEPDMLKHCEQTYVVRAEVRRVIDIVTGEMLTMKTPAFLLQGVHFSGERQLFNAQYEPLYWRSAWLQGEVGRPDPVDRA